MTYNTEQHIGLESRFLYPTIFSYPTCILRQYAHVKVGESDDVRNFRHPVCEKYWRNVQL